MNQRPELRGPPRMQFVVCYNCLSGESVFYATENGFNLVKCRSCGLLFVNPRPLASEIAKSHRVGVHQGSRPLAVTGRFRQGKIKAYLEILGHLFGKGQALEAKDWLDVGCGYGEFLLALGEFSGHRIIARGMEPNVTKQAVALKKGLKVSDFNLAVHAEKYDVVSLLNVYSHLPDPVSFVQSCKRLLKPGGQLLLETGDTATMPSQNHPRPFDLPDHLSFASETIVRGILERNGLDILVVRKYPLIRWNPIAVGKEAVRLLLPGNRSRLRLFAKRKLHLRADMYVLARMQA